MYRAIGLVLDFIHRLVCGRQKIPQRFGDWTYTIVRILSSLSMKDVHKNNSLMKKTISFSLLYGSTALWTLAAFSVS
jgi:hypothetical protein